METMTRTFGTFPPEWGMPPGTQFSEERAAWVRKRVTEHRALVAVRERATAVSATRAAHVRRQRQLLLTRYAPTD